MAKRRGAKYTANYRLRFDVGCLPYYRSVGGRTGARHAHGLTSGVELNRWITLMPHGTATAANDHRDTRYQKALRRKVLRDSGQFD